MTVSVGKAPATIVHGAGHVVHEAALGDPNLTAQSAVAELGLNMFTVQDTTLDDVFVHYTVRQLLMNW
jgi:hypothetical protein